MNPTHNYQPKPNFRQGAWVMYDMTVNRLPRTEAFKRLRKLGYSARQAAEEIQNYEVEG